MIFLQMLVAAFVIGWFFGRRGKNDIENENTTLKLRIDQEIQQTSDKKTKNLLERIKGSVTYLPEAVSQYQQQSQQVAQNTPIATEWRQEEAPQFTDEPILINASNDTVQYDHQAHERKTYIDNTSLLLYFGAFLFITSVGLFIGFAEVAGGLKTAMVALVALIMYVFGFWMYDNKKQLKIVGEAFIGIGMTTIPFVGITAYSFGNNQMNGIMIWLITSVFALGLYAYTIKRLRSTFVSYLLLGSVVSLLLSFAGIIDGPVYYYIWAAAFIGIVLQVISLRVASVPVLQEASHISGQLFAPLALMASFIAAASNTTNGIAQIAVTTGLSACYYGLLAVTEEQNKTTYSNTSHILAILTVALGVFTIHNSLTDVGISLLCLSLLHSVVLLIKKKWIIAKPEHTYIMVTTSILSIVLLLGEPRIATLALVITLILSIILAYSYKYLYAFQVALGSIVALSYACGQWLPETSFNATSQSMLSLFLLLPLIYLLKMKDSTQGQTWKESVRLAISLGLVTATIVAFFTSPLTLLAITVTVSILCIGIYSIDKVSLWRQLEIAFAGVPLGFALLTDVQSESVAYLSLATIVFLLFSISASLKHKLLFARWTSTVAWLFLPVALIGDEVVSFSQASYSVIILYSLVLIALSISRAIALGIVFKNNRLHVPITSLTGKSSHMYYAGMLLSATIIVASSFITKNDLLAVLSLLGIIGYSLYHFHAIEKSNTAISLIPYLLQLVLLRFFEPYSNQINNVEIIYPLVSCFIAITSFVYTYSLVGSPSDSPVPLKERGVVALSALYIAPFSVFYTNGDSWLMPFTAIIALLITLYSYRNNSLENREKIGIVLLLAVFWQLYYFGMRDIQIYTHLTAALLAFYAYVRHTSKQESVSDSYIIAALSVATVPLALEALSGGSSRGEIIGLWLLFEQIGFLILGVTIKKPLLTKWGLYVGIAAILYQLRDLGWAMVAVLSLFIIGIAIFRALKQPEGNE